MLPDSSKLLPDQQELPAAKLGSLSVQAFQETEQTSRVAIPPAKESRGPAVEASMPWQGHGGSLGQHLYYKAQINCSAVVGCTMLNDKKKEAKLFSPISVSLPFVCIQEVQSINLNSLGYVFQYKSSFLFTLKSAMGRWCAPDKKMPESLQMLTAVKLNWFISTSTYFYAAKHQFPGTQKRWKPIPIKISSKTFLHILAITQHCTKSTAQTV